MSSSWEQSGEPQARSAAGSPPIRPWTGTSGAPAIPPTTPHAAPPVIPPAAPHAAPPVAPGRAAAGHAFTGPPPTAPGFPQSTPTQAPAPQAVPAQSPATRELGNAADEVRAWAEKQAGGPDPALPSISTSKAPSRAATEEVVDGSLLSDLLGELLDRGGSDLHLTAGARPAIRVHGALVQLEHRSQLTPPALQKMLYTIITQRQRETFEEQWELDLAYSLPGRSRFRVNLFRQRDAIAAVFRVIPFEIKPLESLGIPSIVADFAMLPRGFALVTGPTGSGKSTTLASIIDLANRQRADHILTVEDPIEFLHRHNRSVINQREVGEDTRSFSEALKHALRQDPDIILVGEMRDLETISVALTAAETGHLVFGTLHTQDAAQTVDRIIDVFPPHQQQQIRVQLAGTLQGVVCQTLCKTADGRGRVVACEIMVCTPAIRNLIREGKTHQIPSAMQAGAQFGMQTLDQHLASLVRAGTVSYETALEKCHNTEDLKRLVGRG